MKHCKLRGSGRLRLHDSINLYEISLSVKAKILENSGDYVALTSSFKKSVELILIL